MNAILGNSSVLREWRVYAVRKHFYLAVNVILKFYLRKKKLIAINFYLELMEKKDGRQIKP